MTVLKDKTLHGEYQITNGYGPDRAPQVMQVHTHHLYIYKCVRACTCIHVYILTYMHMNNTNGVHVCMQNHWNSYITEEDFKYISSKGLNAVRIPVGWWIASDPTPPKPFVGGSLRALDNAFTWAQLSKYILLVYIYIIYQIIFQLGT